MLQTRERARPLVLALGLLASGEAACTAETPARTPTPPADAQCSEAYLASFDPGADVVHREALEPMTQRLGAQTAHLAAIPCEEDEKDDACVARAEREVAEQYPPPMTLSSELFREPKAWRVNLVVDGAASTVLFSTPDAAQVRVSELREAGHHVIVENIEGIPGPDSRRTVNVNAVAPKAEATVVSFRARLTIATGEGEVKTMLEVGRRTRHAGLSIQSFAADNDGHLSLVVSCWRKQGAQGPLIR